jgi:hypothetical protein
LADEDLDWAAPVLYTVEEVGELTVVGSGATEAER